MATQDPPQKQFCMPSSETTRTLSGRTATGTVQSAATATATLQPPLYTLHLHQHFTHLSAPPPPPLPSHRQHLSPPPLAAAAATHHTATNHHPPPTVVLRWSSLKSADVFDAGNRGRDLGVLRLWLLGRGGGVANDGAAGEQLPVAHTESPHRQ